MCGIAGAVGKGCRPTVERMIRAIAHRGPDDEGMFSDDAINVAIAHRRLSILDLSQAGHQPMLDETGRFAITYNGEIYNWRELQAELERCGYRFRSRTDTEVLLYGFREWGLSVLTKIRGMFAFVIVDRGAVHGPDPKNRNHLPSEPYVVLARDRFGIKPLTYWGSDGRLLFASELKGLLASGEVERRADPLAVVEYLALGSVFQPRTIISGVRQLEPGTAVVVGLNGLQRTTLRYWDLAAASAKSRAEYASARYPELVERTRGLLAEATRLHTVADVPVGAFLSGGLDSTAVVALMTAETGQRVRSFAVGFENTSAMQDELAHARVVASALGCDHTEVRITGPDIAQCFGDVVAAIDQPSIDGANTFLVSRLAAQSVKVVLSGLGGDELFAGYPHFRTVARAATAKHTTVTQLLAYIHKIRPSRLTQQAAMMLLPVHGRLASLRRVFGQRSLARAVSSALSCVFRADIADEIMRQYVREDLDPVQQVSYAECRGYLLSTLLRDADSMSMAHALEMRPVLLDHALAEHAFALPWTAKIRGAELKAAFVDAVRDIVPAVVVSRKKAGFELPLGTWALGPLRRRAEERFRDGATSSVFSDGFLERYLDKGLREYAARPAWASLILLEWLAMNECVLA